MAIRTREMLGACCILLLGLLTGCAPTHNQPIPSASSGTEPPNISLPATYTGLVPCADCPGIWMTIQLRPDSIYLLRRIYQEGEDGQDVAFHALGAWRMVDGILTLDTGDRPNLFRWDADSLEMLDAEGQPVTSGLNYALTRVETEANLTGPFPMIGQFSYMADAALFTLCGPNKKFPVAMQGPYLQLERAYLRTQSQPNEKILAKIEGHFAPSAMSEGPPEMIVVDSFVEVTPEASCPH